MKNTTINTQALVNETLTKDEVMSLLKQTLSYRHEYSHNVDDYLTILKGEYTTWDDETHNGYIVCHTTQKYVVPELTHENIDIAELLQPRYETHHEYYFMEVTLEEVVNHNGTCHLWEPTFHMLMPITENYKAKSILPETGNAKDLCNYIVSNAYKDKWDYVYVPMTKEEIEKGKKRDWWWYTHHTTKVAPLTYNDIYCHWSTPLTIEEQKQREATLKAKENVLIRMFSEGELPPAEDTAWYGVLSTGYGTEGYDLECKVIKILKERGFNVYIDGERDSFGWVTRGIFIDDKMMCIY